MLIIPVILVIELAIRIENVGDNSKGIINSDTLLKTINANESHK